MAVTGAQMLRQQISTKVWPRWILISINYFLTICDIHNNWTAIHNEIDIHTKCIHVNTEYVNAVMSKSLRPY